MKLTTKMRNDIASKIRLALLRKSGYNYFVLVSHYETVQITVSPYDDKISLSPDMNKWMEENPLILSEVIQKVVDFRWKQVADTWTIESGAIEYYDTFTDQRNIDHEVKAYYVWDSELQEFDFAGTYDNGRPYQPYEEWCDWTDHGEDQPHEFCLPPDFLKLKHKEEA